MSLRLFNSQQHITEKKKKKRERERERERTYLTCVSPRENSADPCSLG
jgi:hypothetical protein